MIGRTIDRYKITAKIGEGGMGSVWKAEDPLLDREIALKFLSESLSRSPEARKRFLREARAASVLNHPGIATVFDAGEVDGQVYIAFLLVDGQTIHDRVAGGALAADEAVRTIVFACEALQHAHSKGILHRDVTSGNIMTTDSGDVVIVDFGLALPEEASRMTRTGVAMGTAAFMAPEVFLGENSDKRSDLYGLGVVLYHMLTGRLPFEAERQEALVYRVVHEDAQVPSEVTGASPTALDSIVLKALAKDPEDRYQSAEEFARDLRAYAAGDFGSLAAVTGEVKRRARRARIRRTMRRPLSWVIAGVIVAAVGFAGVKTSWFGLVGGPAYASVAVLPLEGVGEGGDDVAWLAEGLGEQLSIKLTQIGLQVSPWVTSSRYSDFSVPFNEVAKSLKVDAVITGRIRISGDRIEGSVSLIDGDTGLQVWVDEFAESRADLFDVQREIALGAAQKIKGRTTGSDEEIIATQVTANVDAFEFYYRGAIAMQSEDYESKEKAMALFEKAIDIDPNLVEAYVGMGGIYAYYFFGGRALRNLELAESNFLKALERNPNSIGARRGLLRIYWNKGTPEECLKIAVAPDLRASDEIDALLLRAEAYAYANFSEFGIPFAERVLALDPENLIAHWVLVIANLNREDGYEAVIETGETYLEKFGDNPEVYYFMGVAYQVLEEPDVARLYYARSKAMYPENYFPITNIWEGFLHKELGDAEQAKQSFVRAVEVLERNLATYPDNFLARGRLAASYGFLGDRELLWREGERYLEAGYRSQELFMVALAHVTVGENERALELMRMGGSGLGEVFGLIELEAMGFGEFAKSPGFREFYAERERNREQLRLKYGPATN